MSYDPVTKTIHWLLFLLVAAQYAVGEIMPHIGRNTRDAGLVAVHMALGATVLATVAVAILWRLFHPVPQLAGLPAWQRVTATLTHWLLLGLVLALTLLGWAASGYRGWTISIFGLIPLPAIAQKGDAWAHTAGDIHNLLVNALLALAALHVAAALYHQFVRHDSVLKRMLPGG